MKPIYTLDIETDPFRFGRLPKPFAIGLYDGKEYVSYWGPDCIERMRQRLHGLKPGIIYAHNGGRFDVFFFLDWIIGKPMRIINSRIIKAQIDCEKGHHEIRDSYAIMPFALAKAKGKTQKRSIEIGKMEASERENNRQEIEYYLKDDCVSLWELCTEFLEMFGDNLTIGGTAMKQLKAIHSFDCLEKADDEDIRKHYYYGGRVQAFHKGVIAGDWKVYDVNSMYPHMMATVEHPVGKPSSEGTRITKDTCFISVEGWNKGAFPNRSKGGGLDFTTERGIFHVTRHEYDTALELRLFEPTRIYRCVNFDQRMTFSEFVDVFYHKRLDAAIAGDGNKVIFYKLILNSSYGKFSQNPENYKEFCITDASTDLGMYGWEAEEIKYGMYIVWSKPSRDTSRYNVAIGASITGAARALLMRGIANATNPIYCDTDSIICESMLLERDATKLGAWKLEAEATEACIAGKKLYALFQDGKVVKQANKGVRITAEEIRKVCLGESVMSTRDAPSFKLNGGHSFIERTVRMT